MSDPRSNFSRTLLLPFGSDELESRDELRVGGRGRYSKNGSGYLAAYVPKIARAANYSALRIGTKRLSPLSLNLPTVENVELLRHHTNLRAPINIRGIGLPAPAKECAFRNARHARCRVFADRASDEKRSADSAVGYRAVVGGTGDFRNVRGEATGFDFSDFLSDGQFTATFKLKGAKGKK